MMHCNTYGIFQRFFIVVLLLNHVDTKHDLIFYLMIFHDIHDETYLHNYK